MLRVPDEIMPDIYATHVAPQPASGDLVAFASGYNMRSDKEWSEAQGKAGALLDQVRAARESLPLAGWEQQARTAFRIGDAKP